MTNNLFSIPEQGAPAPSAPRETYVRAPAPAQPAAKPTTERLDPVEAGRPTGGLSNEREYSTGYSKSPYMTDDLLMMMPERRSSRVKLAVMLALVAILAVGLLGTALVFAAGH